jgi:predicted DNA-binding transcriptional regulator YafY
MEIIEFEILKSNTNNYEDLIERFQEELDSRFGISANIDNEIYNVILEFAEETGEYISSFFIHKSQEFRKIGNIYRLNLRCGINRELVEWIMTWLNKVKIISPQKLIHLHENSLKKMRLDFGN